MSSFSYFFWQSYLIYLGLALVFFGIGLGIGWMLWRHTRHTARRIQIENVHLREEYERMQPRLQAPPSS